MNGHEKGISHYYGQYTDRIKWQQAMKRRNAVIKKLERFGCCPKNPHNMKLEKLEKLVRRAKGWKQEEEAAKRKQEMKHE